MTDLTETEYSTLALALIKCDLLRNWVPRKGDYTLCVLTKENTRKAAQNGHIIISIPFGFPEMSDGEVHDLVQKLDELEKIAWLKESRAMTGPGAASRDGGDATKREEDRN